MKTPPLQVFAGKPTTADKRKGAADPQWAPASAALWSLASQPFERWVCRLAYALLLAAQHPLLAMCRGVARLRAPLAELLLPHVLADLAANDSDGTLRRTLSVKVRADSGYSTCGF